MINLTMINLTIISLSIVWIAFDGTKMRRITEALETFCLNVGKSYFVGIIFKAYRAMGNDTGNFMIGTKVINAAVSPSPNDVLTDPVEMTFEKNSVS